MVITRKYSLIPALLLLLLGFLMVSQRSIANDRFQVDLGNPARSVEYIDTAAVSWEAYKRIKLGDDYESDTVEDNPPQPERPHRPIAPPTASAPANGEESPLSAPSVKPSAKSSVQPSAKAFLRTADRPATSGSRVNVSADTNGTKLVYTRQPYNSAPIPGNTPDSEVANFQYASDVRRINDLLSEADVVIDALDGSPADVIFDCTGNDEYNCVAHEARVSPDGKKIVYSVGFSAPGEGGMTSDFNGLIEVLQPLLCAQLYIYDIEKKTNTPIGNHPGGGCAANYNNVAKAIDRQPAWLSNTELVFVSNRAGKWPHREGGSQHLKYCHNYPYCVSQTYPYGPAGQAMQLWKMNIDGTGAVNWGPQDLNSLAPEVMTNGDVVYSCYNAHAEKGFSPGNNTKIAQANLMWLCRVDGNGADMTVKLHGHKQNILKMRDWLPMQPVVGGLSNRKGGLLGFEDIRGLRSVAEIFKDKLAVTTYYRSNHNGSNGAVYAFDYGDPHVEGCSKENCIKHPYGKPASNTPGSGTFLPSSFKALTPWGQSGDTMPGFEYRGKGLPDRSFGKAGYPAAWDANHFIITHARGQCYAPAAGVQVTKTWLGDNTVCRRTIVKVRAPAGATSELPSTTNPFDTTQMIPLVDDPNYQVWDAKPIKTYQALFGQAAPNRPAPLTPGKCYLQVVDARKSELYARAASHPQAASAQRCAWQGCAVQPQTENPSFVFDQMRYLSVSLPQLWDISYQGNEERYKHTMNTVGFRDIKGYHRAPLEADGSVKMEVPCDTPLLMSGHNANGEVIAHDDMLHSLRPGETRTCHGCHDAHSEERFAELGEVPAVTRFANTLAAKRAPAVGKAHPLPKFAQVQPIITRSCGGCHTGFENDALLYSRVVWDAQQRDFKPWLSITPVMPGVHDNTLWRPLTSRFVSKFALESPLYWYANNKRMDGRTNATFNWDIDYKTGHPDTGISNTERTLLKDWLDNGAPYR
jgi:hypothetical protein